MEGFHPKHWYELTKEEHTKALQYIMYLFSLKPFLGSLNAITSVVLNTNRSGCRLYLVYFFLFCYNNHTIQLYYLLSNIVYLVIIYISRVLLLLLFEIFACCIFGGKSERRHQRRCQNTR